MSRLFGLLCFFAAAVGCRPASVMPTPEEPDIPKPPTDEQTVSVAFLKTLWRGAPTLITGEYRIAGAVVSSDREGNFYKTLVVDDGTAGIEVVLDEEQIFKRFMIHSRVTVRCNGLWLGSRGGTLQLGAEPFEDFQTQRLPRNEIAERLFPDNEFYGEVLPASLSFSELGGQWISRSRQVARR